MLNEKCFLVVFVFHGRGDGFERWIITIEFITSFMNSVSMHTGRETITRRNFPVFKSE